MAQAVLLAAITGLMLPRLPPCPPLASVRAPAPLASAAAEGKAAVVTANKVRAYPVWPEREYLTRNFDEVLADFRELSVNVPKDASDRAAADAADWADGGFKAHKFIAAKASRHNYVGVLSCLLHVLVETQKRFPELYAVLKFVPKKNGLNPFLGQLRDGKEAGASIEDLKPREVRRRLDDLLRALKQSWLLLSCYLTLPEDARDDMLWAARTFVEKIKTDQRSHAIEVLCLGFFNEQSELYPLAREAPLKLGFEQTFMAASEDAKAELGDKGWERSRMVYPFVEMAYRVWLSDQVCTLDPVCNNDPEAEVLVGGLLYRIAAAAPAELTLNSLVYWLLDTCYKLMLRGEAIPRWDPEPYILRREGVEGRMVQQLSMLGHLFQLLGQLSDDDKPGQPANGRTLLRQVKEVETTVTLLTSIQSSCGESCPAIIGLFEEAMALPGLTFDRLEALEFQALAAMLEVDEELVTQRAESVRQSMNEWRNPELLFRYLDDNRNDERLRPLVVRWLRATFGLSNETLRQIRRESDENVRHLLQIPGQVLLRWYSEDCPGTSKCKTLFMLGEDAGSCLRIISDEGNRYNRALMGYVLQSHVRALVVCDEAGRVLVRSLIRLVVRSDSLTPVIFCDPIFFTLGYSRVLHLEMLRQAALLEAYMDVPVVHAGSVLPVLDGGQLAGGFCYPAREGRAPIFSFQGYVRRVTELDYDITWVELIEMDGIAPYTYSEELPYDTLLKQHTPGVLTRTSESPVLSIAVLPRADSPSAERYAAERDGVTAWTMELREDDDDAAALPPEVLEQVRRRTHVAHEFDPLARARDLCAPARAEVDKQRQAAAEAAREYEKYKDWELPENFETPNMDY